MGAKTNNSAQLGVTHDASNRPGAEGCSNDREASHRRGSRLDGRSIVCDDGCDTGEAGLTGTTGDTGSSSRRQRQRANKRAVVVKLGEDQTS
ncbi:hypothetical protein LB503_002366 [Fusarium chuoi]|nr:hypothetical protein LB503_002366 [Fusarium chuoi]